MPLSDFKIKDLKPREKRYQKLDTNGLYIEIMPSGKKFWRLRYIINGKRNWHTIGAYPAVSLSEARDRNHVLRQRLRDGLPLTEIPVKLPEIHTFESLAIKWKNIHYQKLNSEKEKKNIDSRIASHILPFIGDKDISLITPMDILPLLQRLSDRGTLEMAVRVRQIISQIFRYAVAIGRANSDPTYLLRGAISSPRPKHFATITEPKEIAKLLRTIDIYPSAVVRYAMQFSALVFVRPGNIRKAEWFEISDVEWRIPAEKMKMKKPHIVPLATQSLEILKKMRRLTGHGQYIFPSNRAPSGDKEMSENTVREAMDFMGYRKQMTHHGFRAMANTRLKESGLFHFDWIERQLAHAERNKVSAAYNYAEYLPDRRKMMQWWANYLDGLRGLF